MMTSDKIWEQGLRVALLPLDMAAKLPTRPLRFIGFLFGSLLCCPFMLASAGWIVAGTLASMWEAAANREP